ncbi:MAG: acylphosphatase [Candidatus Micrarchaeota archaeon]|nr:acylphosphatase [Candidatus Micrarchaeota archaeon]
MKLSIHIIVKGKVQGVLYRATACEVAEKFGVTGFVRNLEDGSVEVFAEGNKEKLLEFRDWCSKGSKGARVDDMQFEWLDFAGTFKTFIIRH